MAKRNYINPRVIAGTMEALEKYKAAHPEDKTPMANACAGESLKSKKRDTCAPRSVWAGTWYAARDTFTKTGYYYGNGKLQMDAATRRGQTDLSQMRAAAFRALRFNG